MSSALTSGIASYRRSNSSRVRWSPFCKGRIAGGAGGSWPLVPCVTLAIGSFLVSEHESGPQLLYLFQRLAQRPRARDARLPRLPQLARGDVEARQPAAAVYECVDAHRVAQ